MCTAWCNRSGSIEVTNIEGSIEVTVSILTALRTRYSCIYMYVHFQVFWFHSALVWDYGLNISRVWRILGEFLERVSPERNPGLSSETSL